jgi:type II secretory pathway component PulL
VSQSTDMLQQTARPAAHLRSGGWVLRRALLGIFALSVFVLSGAMLLHASIEPEGTETAEHAQSE